VVIDSCRSEEDRRNMLMTSPMNVSQLGEILVKASASTIM